jgi:hypothetical protein
MVSFRAPNCDPSNVASVWRVQIAKQLVYGDSEEALAVDAASMS